MADIVFIIDHLQDVNILRPVMGFARSLPDTETSVLTTSRFSRFDGTGLWSSELDELCRNLEVPNIPVSSDFAAVQFLQGRRGILISSSESTARNHSDAHNLFLSTPPCFVTAVIQHGFECLGFLHNAAHDRAFGRHVGFAADIVCGWFGAGILRSVAPDQRSKLYISGPPLLLDSPRPKLCEGSKDNPPHIALAGLICENLHSVRLGDPQLKSEYLLAFEKFASEAVDSGVDVWLRPHPAGRYTDVRKVGLPANVRKSEGPIYREPFERYHFAISPPSSILFDLIVAEIPVAVWRDSAGEVDCSNYNGLPIVSSTEEWWSFATRAMREPAPLLDAQRDFLRSLEIPEDIPGRFRELLTSFG